MLVRELNALVARGVGAALEAEDGVQIVVFAFEVLPLQSSDQAVQLQVDSLHVGPV